MSKVDDYRIVYRTGRAEGTGNYEITRVGTRRQITKYVERYKTAAGEFLPEDWLKKAKAEIDAHGETDLLKRVKQYCKKHCAWLHTEKELEEHAVDCVCSRAYEHWEGFHEIHS